jgi:precorrin-3B methylase
MNPLQEIVSMYQAMGHEEYLGEAITQLHHALQCAQNAKNQGKDEEVIVTTLADALSFAGKIDMLTILIIGNSSTYSSGRRMITPRGYKLEGKGR